MKTAGGLEKFQKKPTVRKQPRHIKQMAPAAPSGEWGETDAAFDRRQKRVSYAEETMRRARHKHNLIIAIVLTVAICVALVVGIYVYFKSTDSNLRLADETVTEALVPAAEDGPYYVLCSADLHDPSYAYSRPEDLAYMLVRIDIAGRAMTFVTIPSVIEMEFPDEQYRTLADAESSVSDGDIIQAVSSFTGVDVSHYITTDLQSIFDMVELVGAVGLEVPQEVDDPVAGAIVIDAGESYIDSKASMVLLRATNLQGGFEATAQNRVAFTVGLLSAALESQGLGFASIVSDASRYIDTDLTASDLLALGDTLRPLDTMNIYECAVPFTSIKSMTNDSVVNRINKAEWADMMTSVRDTGDPFSSLNPSTEVNAAEVTVEVLNSTSINGAAASLANMLGELGYQVIGTGNTTDGITYPETLVIYTDEAYADAAKAIVRDVGRGRTVNGGDFYSSDAGVLAIIGADWVS